MRVQYKLRQSLHGSSLPAVANVAVAGFVAISVWGVFPAPVILAWLAAMGGATIVRRLAARYFIAPEEPGDNRLCDILLRGSVLFSGILWCSLGLSTVSGLVPQDQLMVIGLATCGMLAGAVFTLTSDIVAFRLYSIPVGIGAISGFLLYDPPEYWAVAGMGCVYFIVVWAWGHVTAKSRLAETRLGYEKQALAERLEQARNDALLAEKLKSDSFAMLGHDLRAPLNAITGFSESIEAEIWGPLGDPRYKDYAATISRSARYLNELAGSILDISRSDAGFERMDSRRVDLRAVADSCIDILGGLAVEKEIDLRIETLGAGAWILGDETKLKQIMINLIANALRFTPNGGKVRVILGELGDGTVGFKVIDTGAGISSDRMATVFDPFVSGKQVPDGGERGNGLGLSISKRLIELHGGTISINSQVGEGTTVKAAFPKR
ncbi:HAMP domain-containing histidine kinase [Rhodospirillaceae bacterium KN72]|uniref:histidine kinase n=1 Tax=Pacificispira spongiicola TaxID=2729598 RepID=A0A7Y0DZ94_9PROT|nr:HAMP domain-containing sensor histidine kinase [Pacificispira spongiicola]NMM44306.1 HAMP domain-containing histidine kinase [Pacificispira spongiicola]